MSNLARIAVVLLLCFPALAQEWLEVKSPHFSVFTDGGEKRGREVALRFEQMRFVFGTLFLKDKVNLPVPLRIMAFRNPKDYAAYSPPGSSGYFQPGEDRAFIVLDLSAEEKWTTVFHEYAHQLLNGAFPQTALWFDEGFAEYFSTLRVTNKVVEIGAPTKRSVVLDHSKQRPVAELFAVTSASPTYRGTGADNQLFYAQSWAMVHYLFDRKKLAEADEYFRLRRGNVAIVDAIRQAFKMEPAGLDRELEEYVRKNHALMARLPMQISIDPSSFAVAPRDPLDARVSLAELRLSANDLSDKTAKELEEVLRLRPEHAGAHRGLGYYYLRRDEFDLAADHFRRAAALDARDPWVHYYSGMLMVRQAMVAGRPPKDLAGLKQHLQAAIALNPDFADAYSLLGFANFVEDDRETALSNCKKAVELSPRNEHYQLNLARAYLLSADGTNARPILERLKTSSDKSISDPAQRELIRAVGFEVEAKRVERHRFPETYDDPRWHRSQEEIEREPEKPAEAPPDTRPVLYVRGELLSVDCSRAPAATLRVKVGTKTLALFTPDTGKLLLFGADAFACGWKNLKVLVNYKPGGHADGDLVSLELQ